MLDMFYDYNLNSCERGFVHAIPVLYRCLLDMVRTVYGTPQTISHHADFKLPIKPVTMVVSADAFAG